MPIRRHCAASLARRQYTGPSFDDSTLHSGAFGLTQNAPEFQWFLRQDTGSSFDDSTLRSGASGLTQKSPEFQWFLRQDTGSSFDDSTLHSGAFALTQIYDKGGGILCGQGAPQLVHVVFHCPAKEPCFFFISDSHLMMETSPRNALRLPPLHAGRLHKAQAVPAIGRADAAGVPWPPK